MRIPGQDDVIAGPDIANGAADLFNDAGRLMAQDHRQRIAQRPAHHFEIGVAKAGGANFDDNVGRAGRAG
jgi:hypothetical protein